MPANYRLTADVGGTFTDIVLRDDAGGRLASGKVLTTPDDPSRAIIEGAGKIVGRQNCDFDAMSRFIHATTLVTNTVIERNGARTGLIMTGGFRDIVEMATETRYDIYDLGIELPAPLVPRDLRREVPERISATGEVLEPVALDVAREMMKSLIDKGVVAVAVCFLHAYVNPEHERKVGELIRREFPEISVSLSSDVQPEIREYERASTTIANAYTQPRTKEYLSRLEGGLRDKGFGGTFNVMLSSGGLTTGRVASSLPIKILESGPAAGVEAARALGKSVGIDTLVSFDMGGTTAKVGLVENGTVSLASQLEVGRLHRFKKGSGLVIKSPTVELIEIGAGGGSIAWIDQYGLLRVGPKSAGSVPGPACYGRGGVEPTVTDADLILGYLDPLDFAGGDIVLDLERAKAAVGGLADKLKLTITEAAWGIHEIANDNMSTAARIHLVERGKDPGGFAFVAFGGAGPTHAQGVAAKLGVKRIIIPRNAGVMSAVGLLAAPMLFDVISSGVLDLAAVDWSALHARFDRLADEGRQQLSGIPAGQVRIVRSADMRYRGQGSEISVPIPGEAYDSTLDAVTLTELFSKAYDETYGRHIEGAPIQLVNLRVRAVADAGEFAFTPVKNGSAKAEPHARSKAYFPEHGYVETKTYRQADLTANQQIEGPAIVRSEEFSALIAPKQHAVVDRFGNLDISI